MSDIDTWSKTKHYLTSPDIDVEEMLTRLLPLPPLERMFWYHRQHSRNRNRSTTNRLFKDVAAADRSVLLRKLKQLNNTVAYAAQHAYGYHLSPSPYDQQAFSHRYLEAWEKLFSECADYPEILVWAAFDSAMSAYR